MMVAATRGKRSIALDAKTADGKRPYLQQLIAGAAFSSTTCAPAPPGGWGSATRMPGRSTRGWCTAELRAFELGPRTELVGNDPIAAAAAG